MAELLDVVELRVASGRWPVGERGTIVETFQDGVLVEISDDDGRTLDTLALPYDAVAVVHSPKQERLAVLRPM